MMGILTEHFGGKWPFWLSPRQIMIVPVMPAVNDYCQEVQETLRAKGFHVDSDLGSNTLQKKILFAQLKMYNFTFSKFYEHCEVRKNQRLT
jgi:threonyl-tRNA synthetase